MHDLFLGKSAGRQFGGGLVGIIPRAVKLKLRPFCASWMVVVVATMQRAACIRALPWNWNLNNLLHALYVRSE
jgi:hypothetical protein